MSAPKLDGLTAADAQAYRINAAKDRGPFRLDLHPVPGVAQWSVTYESLPVAITDARLTADYWQVPITVCDYDGRAAHTAIPTRTHVEVAHDH